VQTERGEKYKLQSEKGTSHTGIRRGRKKRGRCVGVGIFRTGFSADITRGLSANKHERVPIFAYGVEGKKSGGKAMILASYPTSSGFISV